MKSIIYIFLFLIISSIVLPSVPAVMHRNDKTVFLESKDSKFDSAALVNSAHILDFRLKNLNIEDYKITLVKDRPGIQIVFDSDNNYNKSKELLTHKGDLKFVQAINRVEALKILSELNISDELINTSSISKEHIPYIGKYNPEEQHSVNVYIDKHKQLLLNKGLLLTWSNKADENGNLLLYALNFNSNLDINGYVKSARTQKSINSGNEVFVEMSKIGGEKLEVFSSDNLGKNVAIVLDDQVYFAPMVKESISQGKFIISGKFSDSESLLLETIIRSGEIPLDFNIINF